MQTSGHDKTNLQKPTASPGHSRIKMDFWLSGDVDEANSEDEKIGAVVDGVIDDRRSQPPGNREVARFGVGLHHWEQNPEKVRES